MNPKMRSDPKKYIPFSFETIPDCESDASLGGDMGGEIASEHQARGRS
jgi:hypothetical protein